MSGIVSGRAARRGPTVARMNTATLRQALLDASVARLGEIIDLVRRPWAPGNNDALRGAWHEARRHPGAKGALAYALEQEIRTAVSDDRGVDLLRQRLSGAPGTAEAIVSEITKGLGGVPARDAEPTGAVFVTTLQVVVDVARSLLGHRPGEGRSGRRRPHHHGRAAHGR